MKDKISKDQLDGFYAKSRLFGRHGRGFNISIDMFTCPIRNVVWYQFSSNRTKMYEGPSLDEAIELFNNAVAGD